MTNLREINRVRDFIRGSKINTLQSMDENHLCLCAYEYQMACLMLRTYNAFICDHVNSKLVQIGLDPNKTPTQAHAGMKTEPKK